jgi:hypothetical protein
MGAPVGEKAERIFLFWNNEHPNNGWWRRYKGWQDLGCPMPVQDIAYDKFPVQQKLSLEEYFIARMKQAAPEINWTFEDDFPHSFPKHKENWIKQYNQWLDSGCPPIGSLGIQANQPTKKPIRYLNRVNA